MPMRTYSSGMYGRLAFSVAVNMDPDILLIDEALSVGDARFRRKSFEQDARAVRPRTARSCSSRHALGTIKELCDQAIWLHKGELRMWDDADAVVDAYTDFLDVGRTPSRSRTSSGAIRNSGHREGCRVVSAGARRSSAYWLSGCGRREPADAGRRPVPSNNDRDTSRATAVTRTGEGGSRQRVTTAAAGGGCMLGTPPPQEPVMTHLVLRGRLAPLSPAPCG